MNGASDAPVPDRESHRTLQGTRQRGLIRGRTPWLDLAEPWEELEIRAWLDYPKRVQELWTPPDNETVEDRGARFTLACQTTFLDHRVRCRPGVDEYGRDHSRDPQTCQQKHEPWEIPGEDPLPQCEDAEFWERIPQTLVGAIIARFSEEFAENPTNRASRRFRNRNSRRR